MLSRINSNGRIITSGINLRYFKKLDKILCRQYLNFDHNHKYILFCGDKKDPNKNYNLFSEVIKTMSNRNSSIKEINAYNLSRKDLVILMNACDLLLFTSTKEGSPSTIKEALCCVLPIVSLDVGDTFEVLKNYEYGTVSDNSVEMLAEHCLNFCERKISKGSINFSKIPVSSKEEVSSTIFDIYEGFLG